MNLSFLSFVENVNSADFPPTTQLLERYEELRNLHESYRNQFNELLKKDLPVFNNLLKENNIPHTITIEIPWAFFKQCF